MSTITLEPKAQPDPTILDAAQRLFRDLSASLGSGESGLAERAGLLKKIQELGFDQMLEDPADKQAEWPDAASLLREQARYATPVDMATLLILRQPELSIMPPPVPYQAVSAQWTSTLTETQKRGLNLARCLQACGAMQAALDLTMQYVQDRKQFGRPLAKFQAVQHELAVAAAETAAATAMTDLCLAAVSQSGLLSTRVEPLLQAASIVMVPAMTCVYRVSHQMHGAIGFTREYSLHQHTLNLLRWRDQIGHLQTSPISCSRALGKSVFASTNLWTFITDTMKDTGDSV